MVKATLQKMKTILYFPAAVYLLLSCQPLLLGEIKEAQIPDTLLVCKKSTDCTEVDKSCDHCCGTAVVAKASLKEFQKIWQATCSQYHGSVCDCAPAAHKIECKMSKCTVVYTNLTNQ